MSFWIIETDGTFLLFLREKMKISKFSDIDFRICLEISVWICTKIHHYDFSILKENGEQINMKQITLQSTLC